MKYPHLKELLLACNSSDLVESIWDDCADFQFISIDCEMIVTTVDPKCLARIGATKAEEVILHEFVKPRGVVKDYLHSITGLNEELLKKAQFTHPQVRQKVTKKRKKKKKSWTKNFLTKTCLLLPCPS